MYDAMRTIPSVSDVLVIGSGLAGATAARALVDAGYAVLVLDKSRGPGGRLSTRHVDGGSFDHGAAWLQARDARFVEWLDMQVVAGHAARWRNGWVGRPGMNALVSGVLRGIDVRWNNAVSALAYDGKRWRASDHDGVTRAEAPALVLAIPAPQARALLLAGGSDTVIATLADALEEVRYAPCWTGLITTTLAFSASEISSDGTLDAVFREYEKPGRPNVGHWVVHASAAWSERHLELAAESVAPLLAAAFARATACDAAAIRSITAHRWRYARPLRGTDVTGRADRLLALAGDAIAWHSGDGTPPAERAWRSGIEAAECLIAALGTRDV